MYTAKLLLEAKENQLSVSCDGEARSIITMIAESMQKSESLAEIIAMALDFYCDQKKTDAKSLCEKGVRKMFGGPDQRHEQVVADMHEQLEKIFEEMGFKKVKL